MSAGPGAARVSAGRAPAPAVLRRSCACGASGPDCEPCRKKDKLRRKSDDATVETVPASVSEVLRSPGRPLDGATRALLEPRFGHDFSRVRIHADVEAGESALALNARAYTVGPHVVFAPGHYDPQTSTGRALLAHELAHVAREEAPGETVESVREVGSASDPAEREADAVAERALAGPPVAFLAGRGPRGSLLRRKVLNSVVTDFQKRAQACTVHMHGEEKTALAVGKEIRNRRCVNFMHLDTTDRPVRFEFTESGVDFIGRADPNRILTPAGRSGSEAIQSIEPKTPGPAANKVGTQKRRTAAEKVLQEFADQEFLPKLAECRKSERNPDVPLPVMALHNNEGLIPSVTFRNVASKARTPNPAAGDPGSASDFLLVTQPADFDAFKSTHNVVLQENPVRGANDDGSLSVVLANERFVNVEKEGRLHGAPVKAAKGSPARQDDVYIKNYAMAGAVLDRFGVLGFPCGGSPLFERRTRSMFNRRLGQSGRVTTTLSSDAAMLDRDPLPDPAPAGCLLFKDQPALDKHADEWRRRLERLPLLNLIHWVLGGPNFTPPEPLAEFKAQQKCLIDTMKGRLKALGLGLPPGGLVRSEQRSFASQESIWSRKFAFQPPAFDRISDFARDKCKPDLGSDVRWDPKNKTHQKCWGQLSSDEKQKEILMASSAPGISRHHAGVDFDFGQSEADLDPKAWTGSGRFADAYRWLARNAATFGFIQPFDTKGGYGQGYMSERWHWSYFPVAQAALEFVMDYDQEVESALQDLWSDGQGGIKPEFSFIAKDWRKYLFNVEDLGVF